MIKKKDILKRLERELSEYEPKGIEDIPRIIRLIADYDDGFENLVFEYGLKKLVKDYARSKENT